MALIFGSQSESSSSVILMRAVSASSVRFGSGGKSVEEGEEEEEEEEAALSTFDDADAKVVVFLRGAIALRLRAFFSLTEEKSAKDAQ